MKRFYAPKRRWKLAKNLRVAIIGFGPFGREVAKLLYGEVDDFLILGKKAQHLEQFLEDERYARNVVVLEGDIDTETVDGALVELGLLPALKGSDGNGSNGNSEHHTQRAEVAVIDLDAELNSHIVKKLFGYVVKIIVSAPSSANIEDFEKDGADLVVCAYAEAALRTVHNMMNPLVEDTDKVSENLYEETLSLPDSANGKTIGELMGSSGVRVIFIVQSIPRKKRMSKKIEGYVSKEELFPDDSRVISESDTSIRVVGSLKQIKELESELAK